MVQVLIIDDDPAIQLLLKRTLKSEGYELTVASDGEEGLTKAKDLHPSLVICDWIMPRMDGLDVCRHIKAIPELNTTFFILLTSMGSVDDRVKGLDAGADDFLCKPIEMNELKARVRSGLRLHQLSRDLKEQKQILEAELAEAAEYVCSILPPPLTQQKVAIDSRFIPSHQLGGDCFDYYWLDEHHLAIYLLDVAGHGLRAALPSLSVLNLLKTQALSKVDYYRPAQVLQGLNETFQMTQRNDKYFTIWYGVYNTKTRHLVYSSAGHPPAILLELHHPQTPKRLKTPGLPVGMFPDVEYVEASCEVKHPSNLYVFSDGIYEINLSQGQVWGLDAFVELLCDHQSGNHPHLESILTGVQKVNPKPYFDDDLSLLEVQFR